MSHILVQIGKFPKVGGWVFQLSIVVKHLLALNYCVKNNLYGMMVWFIGVVGWCCVVELLTVWWWWWSWIWSIINIPLDSKSCMISWCIWIRLENKRHNIMVNVEKFFISFNFAFSMTLISNVFWTSIISVTSKCTNGIFTWLIILSNLTKKWPFLMENGTFLLKNYRFWSRMDHFLSKICSKLMISGGKTTLLVKN